MSKEKKQRVSRREFLKGAAAAGATMAAAGMLGPLTPTASAQVPDKWDAEADVIVVGTGMAGYGAAIEAKDAGADVMMIEKEKWYGGNSVLAGGNCQMPVNHINKAAGIEDRPEWAYEDYWTYGQHRGVPEMIKLFVDNAADTALWLEKLGVVWNKTPSLQGDCRVARTLVPTVSATYPGGLEAGINSGMALIAVLNKAATDRKITMKMETKLTRLIRTDPKGPVIGIEAVSGGKTLNFKAKRAVVLATGGFKVNNQMVRAWHPLLDETFQWSGGPYTHTVGEGHLAAMAIGAGLTDTSFTMGFPNNFGRSVYVYWDPVGEMTAKAKKSPVLASPLGTPDKPSPWAFLVENDGNRYVDENSRPAGEGSLDDPWTVAWLMLPKRPRNVWAVVDSAGAAALKWNLDDFKNASETKSPYLDPKWVAYADTIADLATKMGMPPANLEATVKKYNEYAAAGVDKDFKKPKPFNPIAQGPFFGAKMILFAHDQSNGVRVNTKLQVIDQTFQLETGSAPSVPLDKERVIPHLYGAGEFAGGTFGAARGSGKMGSYAVQGRLAGKNAAKETPVT